jgi:4'-phosphopantetheinyl transferase EntD
VTREGTVALERALATLLHDQERRAVVRAVTSRREEFALGRTCARAALGRLGSPADAPIPVGRDREPVWPEAVTGSIAHCSTACVAAAAPRRVVASIGIDVEPARPLPDDVARLVVGPQESSDLHDDPLRSTLAFCAMEAAFKAWFPLHRRWIGPEEVGVELDPRGTFRIALTQQEGRWIIVDGHVLTACVTPVS